MKKIAKNKIKKAIKRVVKEVGKEENLKKRVTRSRAKLKVNKVVTEQPLAPLFPPAPHLANTKPVHKLLENYLKIQKFKNPEENKNSEMTDQSEISTTLPEMPTSNLELKIFAWNVNGFRALLKKGKFEDFIKKEDPDIICLGETKIDDEKINSLGINTLLLSKYKLAGFWDCCKIKKGYSGVAILTKYKPLNVIRGMNVSEHDQEGRCITLEFPNFYIVSVYVPNSGGRLGYRCNSWDVDFQNYLKNLKSNKDVIVCGDLNVAHNPIDLTHAKANEGETCYTIEERTGFSNFLNAGFIDTFRHLCPTTIKYSYFSSRLKSNYIKNVGWRLDYFIINSEAVHRLVKSDILKEYDGSDHVPIKLNWKI